MGATACVWGILVVSETQRFPNFFPIGIYSIREKEEQELENLPKDNNYQLLRFPLNKFFGYYNKNRDIVGMDGI